MNHDIDIKKMRINCFRQSKVNGEFMLQMRVPGSLIDAKHLSVIQHICETWGNGTFHIGTRQTLNAPGVKYENIPAVRAYLSDYIHDIEVELCGAEMEEDGGGYPTIGARNITACIGNSHCIKANINTWDLARKLEPLIFPSHYHIKIAVTGCPNDCAKAHITDFGILGMAKMEYIRERCIGCGACVKACDHHSTRVLKFNENHLVEKDDCCCIGCGECVLACPASAWVRKPTKFYRVILGGRTGRQTPRLGKTFLSFVTEDVVLAVIGNWQKFSAWALDYKPEYLHGGHLIDRTGYERFKEKILEGVELNPEALVAEHIHWSETEYRGQIHMKPLATHHTAGPSAGSGH